VEDDSILILNNHPVTEASLRKNMLRILAKSETSQCTVFGQAEEVVMLLCNSYTHNKA
jgi:hypothetical protein